MSIINNLKNDFEVIFGLCSNVRSFFAPGRVNLIGEHTDYNGGYVFPCALTFGTYAIARKREDNIVRMTSNNFKNEGLIEFSLDNLEYDKKHDWANYPKGVMSVFKNNKFI